jgi:hypothetical protein
VSEKKVAKLAIRSLTKQTCDWCVFRDYDKDWPQDSGFYCRSRERKEGKGTKLLGMPRPLDKRGYCGYFKPLENK